MANNKKFYWLKLKTDFFNQREVKKLRKIAGGDTYTIIYLKLQLLCTKTDGVIKFEGTEKNLIEQLELELDEDFDNIQVTFSFLQANGLIEQINQNDFLMPKVCENTGKEGSSAERVRQHRRIKALQCNNDETNSNTEKEKEKREKRKDIIPTQSQIEAEEVSKYLANKILSENKNAKINHTKWVNDIEKALRLDNRSKQDLFNVINWIYTPIGAFWKPNIMSGKKLREKYDQLFMQMSSKNQNKPQYGQNRGTDKDFIAKAVEERYGQSMDEEIIY